MSNSSSSSYSSDSESDENSFQRILYDVLYPELFWFEGSCYRIDRKPYDLDSEEKKPKNETSKTTFPLKSYEEYDHEEMYSCHENNEIDIEVTESGRFVAKMHIPQVFYSYIIGTKGSRRRKLEDETKTTIILPKQNSNNKIKITGSTERNVATAIRRLQLINIDLRNKHEITHFISFPMISDEIKANFIKFKELVLSEGNIDGVDETIFNKVDKLHLTIGTLVLLDEEEKENASDVLKYCKKDVIDPLLNTNKPLLIKMKGLEYMNDDPTNVDVLYATAKIENHENSDILQLLSDKIVNYFAEKGIMKKETDHVKLHVTVMNTRYRKDIDTDRSESGSRDRNRRRKRKSFDAKPILDKYSDFEFGVQQFNSIHLSHRFSVAENGYYEATCAISIV